MVLARPARANAQNGLFNGFGGAASW